MTLYGKEPLKSRLDLIAKKGRLPHAVMFSGSKGSGRKVMSRYAAQLMLCENGGCGHCVTCSTIERDSHPDVIFVKKSMPEEKYAIAPFRDVLRDTVIRPNNGAYKIYIFEDCDDMSAFLHNALLKSIEEPEKHLRFIFTAENTAAVPETVMSRVTEFELPETSAEDCVRCLADEGVDRTRAAELAELFSGNIGRCKAFLSAADKESDAELAVIQSARNAAAALGRRDAFRTAAALTEQTGRTAFAEVFRILSHILRDALAVKNGCNAEFLAKNEARQIAEAFSSEELLKMLDTAFEIEQNAAYNINLALTVSYFISQIFN